MVARHSFIFSSQAIHYFNRTVDLILNKEIIFYVLISFSMYTCILKRSAYAGIFHILLFIIQFLIDLSFCSYKSVYVYHISFCSVRNALQNHF